MKINIDNNDIIKTFIKIESNEDKIDNIYEIDKSKQYLTINNKELKNNIQDTIFFEFDRIFNNNDSNSAIYKEICLNTIKECFNGVSSCFINYGETISNKFNLLFGNIKDDYNNINNYGLFIQFLSRLIHYKKYNIKLSYFLIYEDNLIDLSIYSNKNNNNLTVEEFLRNSFKIKQNINIIDKIKKKSCDSNIMKIIIFLNNIINVLLKFEYEDQKNIYSLSHICSIIYLLDSKEHLISTIIFLCLNGNEYLYDIQNEKSILNKTWSNKSNFEIIKNSFQLQFTYDNIINCIKSNNYILNNLITKKNLRTEKNENICEIKQELLNKRNIYKVNEGIENQLSKLCLVLYNICFGKNIPNIKFRIIGNIKPITGFLQTTRDTLLFVSNFSKIFKKETINSDKISFEIKEIETKTDLKNKISSQAKEIENLTNIISKKEEKIVLLTEIYNKQINTLKEYFDFKGDINILLSDDINSKEANYIRSLKNSNFTIKRQEGEINILKEKLENSQKEMIKYKNIAEIRENDKKMIDYYMYIQNLKDNKLSNQKEMNYLFNNLNKKIEKLNNKINSKDKIIEELKKDLNSKNKILCNLPKSIKEMKENNLVKDITDNKNDKKQSEWDDEIILKNETQESKLEDEKQVENLKIKYDAILSEKKNKIYNLEKKLVGIEEIYKNEINQLNKELVRLYEILLYIIINYKTNFCKKESFEEKNLNVSKKEELDKIILNIDKDINCLNFSRLYKELENQKKTKKSIIQSLDKDKIYKIIKNDSIGIEDNKKDDKLKELDIIDNEMKEKDIIISRLNNKILKMVDYIDKQAERNNYNNIIINSQKRTIDKMQKDAFYHNLLKNKFNNKIKNNFLHNKSSLFEYKNKLRKNISNEINKSDLDSSENKNRIINNYQSFISPYKNNELKNYSLNISKIYNKNELMNNGLFDNPSYNTFISNNTKNSSTTNILKSSKKVFNLKKKKRPYSSYTNRNLNNSKNISS